MRSPATISILPKSWEKKNVDPTTGLSEGFQITIRFNYGFKNMSRQKARRM